MRKDEKLSVRRQCQLLGISRTQVYYEPSLPNEQELERKEMTMSRIDYWHTQMPYLGTRRIVEQLRKEGYVVGRKSVRSYMRDMGIHAVYPKPNLSQRNFKESVVPYLLKNKVVSIPNQVWSIDITYIKMGRSHMYLTAIIDWYSRKIVGWNLSHSVWRPYGNHKRAIQKNRKISAEAERERENRESPTD